MSCPSSLSSLYGLFCKEKTPNKWIHADSNRGTFFFGNLSETSNDNIAITPMGRNRCQNSNLSWYIPATDSKTRRNMKHLSGQSSRRIMLWQRPPCEFGMLFKPEAETYPSTKSRAIHFNSHEHQPKRIEMNPWVLQTARGHFGVISLEVKRLPFSKPKGSLHRDICQKLKVVYQRTGSRLYDCH